MLNITTTNSQRVYNFILSKSLEGGSVNPINLNTPKSGYMVSLRGCEEIYKRPSDISQLFVNLLIDKITHLLNVNDYYIGVWRDEETGLIYVDLSVNIAELSTALKVAEYNNQLAIYDVENNKVIYLRK